MYAIEKKMTALYSSAKPQCLAVFWEAAMRVDRLCTDHLMNEIMK